MYYIGNFVQVSAVNLITALPDVLLRSVKYEISINSSIRSFLFDLTLPSSSPLLPKHIEEGAMVCQRSINYLFFQSVAFT